MPHRVAIACAAIAGIAACGPACQAPSPPSPPASVDREQALLEDSAAAAFIRGQFDRAAEFYADSLDRAYLRDDAAAIVDAAYNRAACLMRLRRHEDAAAALAVARAALRPDMQRSQLDVLLLEAALLRAQGRTGDAEERVRHGLEITPPNDSRRRTSFALLRAGLACDRDDAAAAREALEVAGRRPQRGSLAARYETVSARIAALEERPADAAAGFDRATALYRDAGNYAAMAKSLARAADAHARAGDGAAAANRWLRAGRSAALQDLPDAPDWLQNAANAADQAGDGATAAEARRWLDADRE